MALLNGPAVSLSPHCQAPSAASVLPGTWPSLWSVSPPVLVADRLRKHGRPLWPLALRHWVACGGLMARQCWTVLYHGAFDPMACLAHCVQPPHPTPGLPEPLRWQAPGSRSLMPGSLSSYSYDLHLRTWPPAHSSLQVGS